MSYRVREMILAWFVSPVQRGSPTPLTHSLCFRGRSDLLLVDVMVSALDILPGVPSSPEITCRCASIFFHYFYVFKKPLRLSSICSYSQMGSEFSQSPFINEKLFFC